MQMQVIFLLPGIWSNWKAAISYPHWRCHLSRYRESMTRLSPCLFTEMWFDTGNRCCRYKGYHPEHTSPEACQDRICRSKLSNWHRAATEPSSPSKHVWLRPYLCILFLTQRWSEGSHWLQRGKMSAESPAGVSGLLVQPHASQQENRLRKKLVEKSSHLKESLQEEETFCNTASEVEGCEARASLTKLPLTAKAFLQKLWEEGLCLRLHIIITQ